MSAYVVWHWVWLVLWVSLVFVSGVGLGLALAEERPPDDGDVSGGASRTEEEA